MSVSLGTFIAVADRSPGNADIRFAKGDGDQLVNKGTLGNRVASWFRGIGEGIGLVGADATRAGRQTGALESFKRALRSEYGDAIADRALGAARLSGGDARLTAAGVRGAVAAARADHARVRADLGVRARDFTPGRPGFARIAGAVMPSAAGRAEYMSRLDARLKLESRNGKIALAPAEIEKFAKETFKEVGRLSGIGGALDRSRELQRGLVGGLKDVLRGMADGRSSATMAQRMIDAQAQRDAVLAFDHPEGGAPEKARVFDLAMNRAIAELMTEDPNVLVAAQQNALKREGSPLRGLAVAGEAYSQQGDLSGAQIMFARGISRMSEEVVGALALAMGARGGASASDDEAMMRDPTRLPPGELAAAQRALGAHIERIPVGIEVGHQFVRDVARDFRGTDGAGNPAWNTPEVLRRLEVAVNRHCEVERMPPADAIIDFRAAVTQATDLPPGLRDKLLAALDARDQERPLANELDRVQAFNGVKGTKAWQLALPVRPGLDRWDHEQRAPGAYAAGQRAFVALLKSSQDRTPIDGGLVEMMHHAARPEGAPRDAFRSGAAELALPAGSTPAGREELRLLHEQDQLRPGPERWFAPMPDGGAPRLAYVARTPEQVAVHTDAILNGYRAELAALADIEDPDGGLEHIPTADEKLAVIGRAVQALARANVFRDDEQMLGLVMNRMLLDNGLSPAVLDSRAAVGVSGAEFLAQIREGQARFGELRR